MPPYKEAIKNFLRAWDGLRPSATNCAAKKGHTATPQSPRAPGQRQFRPPTGTGPAPKAHREEAQTEIGAGILPANRDIQKWRRKGDINGRGFRPVRSPAEARGATWDAPLPGRESVPPSSVWPVR